MTGYLGRRSRYCKGCRTNHKRLNKYRKSDGSTAYQCDDCRTTRLRRENLARLNHNPTGETI